VKSHHVRAAGTNTTTYFLGMRPVCATDLHHRLISVLVDDGAFKKCAPRLEMLALEVVNRLLLPVVLRSHQQATFARFFHVLNRRRRREVAHKLPFLRFTAELRLRLAFFLAIPLRLRVGSDLSLNRCDFRIQALFLVVVRHGFWYLPVQKYQKIPKN
jgi:hypothetical protein